MVNDIREDFSTRLNAFVERNGLIEDDEQAAKYFGVPVSTYLKWKTPQRTPSAATVRLLEIVELVEALAPGLHRHFVQGVVI